ncbi:hypothetical protein C8R42DRAFT_716877 [Lentinula raphanica]|nr:hypothetical protein C8R42DRAFT_716877 [Lentinula raphanica]
MTPHSEIFFPLPRAMAASCSNSYTWGATAFLPPPSFARDALPRSTLDSELTYSRERRQPHSEVTPLQLEDYLFSYQNALTASYSSNLSLPSSYAPTAVFIPSDELLHQPKTTASFNASHDKLSNFDSLRRNYLQMLANEPTYNSLADNLCTKSLADSDPQTTDLQEDPQLSSAYDSFIASEFLREEQYTDFVSSSPDASPILDNPSSSSSFQIPIMKSSDSSQFGQVERDSLGREENLINTPTQVKSALNPSTPAVLMGQQTTKESNGPPSLDKPTNLRLSMYYPEFVSSELKGSFRRIQRPSSPPADSLRASNNSSSSSHVMPISSLPSSMVANRTRPVISAVEPSTRPWHTTVRAESNATVQSNGTKRSYSETYEDDNISERHNNNNNDVEAVEDLSPSSETPAEKPPGPNATESEKLAYKRRRCTLAARRSRRRKVQYQLSLEAKVEELERQREMWRTRCSVLQEVLRGHDADLKFEEDF